MLLVFICTPHLSKFDFGFFNQKHTTNKTLSIYSFDITNLLPKRQVYLALLNNVPLLLQNHAIPETKYDSHQSLI